MATLCDRTKLPFTPGRFYTFENVVWTPNAGPCPTPLSLASPLASRNSAASLRPPAEGSRSAPSSPATSSPSVHGSPAISSPSVHGSPATARSNPSKPKSWELDQLLKAASSSLRPHVLLCVASAEGSPLSEFFAITSEVVDQIRPEQKRFLIPLNPVHDTDFLPVLQTGKPFTIPPSKQLFLNLDRLIVFMEKHRDVDYTLVADRLVSATTAANIFHYYVTQKVTRVRAAPGSNLQGGRRALSAEGQSRPRGFGSNQNARQQPQSGTGGRQSSQGDQPHSSFPSSGDSENLDGLEPLPPPSDDISEWHGEATQSSQGDQPRPSFSSPGESEVLHGLEPLPATCVDDSEWHGEAVQTVDLLDGTSDYWDRPNIWSNYDASGVVWQSDAEDNEQEEANGDWLAEAGRMDKEGSRNFVLWKDLTFPDIPMYGPPPPTTEDEWLAGLAKAVRWEDIDFTSCEMVN